jgi:hypothetical protein
MFAERSRRLCERAGGDGRYMSDGALFVLPLPPMLGQFAVLWPCPAPPPLGDVVGGEVELDWA